MNLQGKKKKKKKKKLLEGCTSLSNYKIKSVNPPFKSHLLGVLKLPPETLIHSFGGLLRTTHDGLNIDLKATVQELVDLSIIIVIIPE